MMDVTPRLLLHKKKICNMEKVKDFSWRREGWRGSRVLLLKDSRLEIEFVHFSQLSVHNRNTNHQC